MSNRTAEVTPEQLVQNLDKHYDQGGIDGVALDLD